MAILYESYSTSPEVKVTAEKKATEMRISITNPDETIDYRDKTLKVGTVVRVSSTLYTEPWFTSLYRKRHIIYHRLNTGAWETIADATSPSGPAPVGDNEVVVHYTLPAGGIHTFKAEFPGDSAYAGCSKAVKSFAR